MAKQLSSKDVDSSARVQTLLEAHSISHSTDIQGNGMTSTIFFPAVGE